MPTSPLTGTRYPALSDAPNGPQQIQNAVFDLDDNGIPFFTSTSARTTAYANWVTAGGVMRNGLYCHVNGLGLCRYNAGTSAWVDSTQPTSLPTSGGWTASATGTGTTEQPAQYWRDVFGIVHVTGTVQKNASYTPSTTEVVATLPTGFRPTGWISFIAVTNSVADYYVTGDINFSNGQIRMVRNAGGAVGSGVLHNINLHFPAA